MGTLLYILLAIVIFGVLIAVHELGHFLAARLCGVKVLEFAIGMGPAIWKKESKSGTQISLRCLPIGGYCAMEGEDEDSEDPRAFSNAAVWKRLIILAAGAFMNFLLGFVLIVVCFSQLSAFTTPTITSFMDGCPYEGEDGLMVGDTFYKINGERIYFSSDVSTYLQRSGSDYADIVVIRDGEKVTLEDYYITLLEYTDPDTGEAVMRYGLYFGVKETGVLAQMKYSWYCAMDFVRMVRLGLLDLITGAVGVDQMSGVVGIVDMIAEVGTESATTYDAFLNIAYLAAFIAINLAVMNLLPLPALDGGRIFFLLVTWVLEKLTRKKIDPKYEAYINTAGLVLLMGLMVFVMYNDIVRIVTG
ncbi:MAG: site-2 protease family protein [Oscillospiraceae bacterium]|nr:site-2 protease family protein [Oscillospiraceae bacterium]